MASLQFINLIMALGLGVAAVQEARQGNRSLSNGLLGLAIVAAVFSLGQLVA